MQKNKKYECLLAEQMYFNSKCKSNSIDPCDPYKNLGVDYDKIVKMKNVTGLSKVKFSDEHYLEETVKSAKPSEPRVKGKMVKFTEKFKDTVKNVDSSTDKTYEVNSGSLKGNQRELSKKIRIRENF